eukprot:4758474-Alexandrium_andersonii.AAC.1
MPRVPGADAADRLHPHVVPRDAHVPVLLGRYLAVVEGDRHAVVGAECLGLVPEAVFRYLRCPGD